MTSESSTSTGSGRSFTYRLAAGILKPVLVAMGVKDWQGTEHLPTTGGYLAVANHITNLDPLTFAHFLYDSSRPPRILAKASLWKVPVLKGVLVRTGMIPVHRGTAGAASSLADAVRQLESGECVAVFPEGTLTRDPDLWPMVGKTGAARLALSSGVPVIPVAQWGPQLILPQYSKRLHPFPRKKVSVHAGPPVDLSDLLDRPQDAAVLTEATERIMAAITALLEEIRGEKAPAVRYDMRKAARAQQAAAAASAEVPAGEPDMDAAPGTVADAEQATSELVPDLEPTGGTLPVEGTGRSTGPGDEPVDGTSDVSEPDQPTTDEGRR
ncbi:lysophospholipid acyltransferase family protein [Sanguibacter inulinus]|uniref:1-acyl-sn-glycerol-3-phosphate acyltransferase n=1 Tax=Sanguibacter inulinus TaxID=60922 RepID=A0A853EV73_9MICO|nr:lysophospholipid acyltransferase family protein [Sanguibacter inulinus]MBF0722427.1 1-acyl-sn-glycerol-3-phosphate acyltransferase [Sanguibacter inulinus]NYS93572.1 1-acyl-sn-glycerol-3-phosphate acyltransferase [Sanguibacter inulinus]